jgi:hypothetical protein
LVNAVCGIAIYCENRLRPIDTLSVGKIQLFVIKGIDNAFTTGLQGVKIIENITYCTQINVVRGICCKWGNMTKQCTLDLIRFA